MIRPATKADCALLAQLIRELAIYEKLEHQVQVTPEVLAQTMFCANPRAFAIIAESDGKPVGFALYFYNFSTFLGKPGLYIEDIFVREAARGKGVGKALFTELCKIATQQDCGRMEWWALDWNKSAIDFYLKQGAEAMDEWTVYRLRAEQFKVLAD